MLLNNGTLEIPPSRIRDTLCSRVNIKQAPVAALPDSTTDQNYREMKNEIVFRACQNEFEHQVFTHNFGNGQWLAVSALQRLWTSYAAILKTSVKLGPKLQNLPILSSTRPEVFARPMIRSSQTLSGQFRSRTNRTSVFSPISACHPSRFSWFLRKESVKVPDYCVPTLGSRR